MSAPNLYLYLAKFGQAEKFWEIVRTVCEKTPEAPLIITPTQAIKEQVVTQLKIKNIPILALDALLRDLENHELTLKLEASDAPKARQILRFPGTVSQLIDAQKWQTLWPKDAPLEKEWADFIPHSSATKPTQSLPPHKTCFWIGFSEIESALTPVIDHILKTYSVHSFLIFSEENHPLYAPCTPFLNWLQAQHPQLRKIQLPDTPQNYPRTQTVSCSTFTEEIEAIISHIQTHNSQEMTIICPPTPDYSYTLTQALIRHNIPIQTTITALLTDPQVKTWINALPSSLQPEKISLPTVSAPLTLPFQEKWATFCQHVLDGNLPPSKMALITHLAPPITTHPNDIGICIQSSEMPRVSSTSKLWICGLQTLTCPHPIFIKKTHQDSARAKLNEQLDYRFFSWVYHCQSELILSFVAAEESPDLLPSRAEKLQRQWGIHLTPTPIEKKTSQATTKPPQIFGDFKQENALSRLDPQIKDRVFSGSQLETFQKCPYQYYFKYILKLAEDPQPIQDIPAHVWGEKLHDFLKEFFNQHPIETISRDPELALSNAQTLARQKFQLIANAFWEWDIKLEKTLKTLLPALIHYLVETEFDFTYHDTEETLTYQDDQISLKGRLDVILKHKNPQTPWMGLLDYKTGKATATKAEIDTLRSLQIPIYMLLLQKKYPESPIFGAYFFKLPDENHIENSPIALTPEAKDAKVVDLKRKSPAIIGQENIQALKNLLHSLKAQIQAGQFSPQSEERLPHTAKNRPDTCQFCAYQRSCKDDQRYHP